MSGQVSSVGAGDSVKAVDERVCISVLKDLKEIHCIFFCHNQKGAGRKCFKGVEGPFGWLAGVIHLIVQT